MRTVSRCVCAAALLAGCSIHPLPEDVTRETTFQIVQKIRCEARDALTDISVAVLRTSDDPATLALADRVASRELKVTDLFEQPNPLRATVDPRVHAYFDTFALSTVAFDFTFDISETNEATADVNFRNPFTTGIFRLGVKGGNKLERRNTRTFQVGETFLELYELLPDEECDAITAGRGNYLYPITGKIGLREVFETFIRLNSRSLDPRSPRPVKGAKDDVRRFLDTLAFTTTISGSLHPRVELAPIADERFRLVDASSKLEAIRKDLHQVKVAVLAGESVRSLAEARRKAGIARQRAFNQLDLNRTEDFFATQRQILRRLDELLP